MYAYIKGTLEEVLEGLVIVENNGIGYEVNTSYETISQLPALGADVKLYTRFVVREDSNTLFGFYSNEEKSMFDLLLTVNGIGPKAALSILSVMTVADIKFAVIGGDSKAIAKAPGVGKKTAERAIIDLKDKVELLDAFEGKLAGTVSKKDNNITSVREEVLDALVSLGYSASAAAKALEKMTITENTTVDTLLSDTLKQMSFL